MTRFPWISAWTRSTRPTDTVLLRRASEYSKEFLRRFEAAQQGWMQKLIAKAYGMVAERQRYQKLLYAPDFSEKHPQEQLRIQRGAIVQRYMTIYRNFANLYYMIPTIDPDDRLLGVLSRPDLRNYYAHYHPRNTTPEAFLSGNFPGFECVLSEASSCRDGAGTGHPWECRSQRSH